MTCDQLTCRIAIEFVGPFKEAKRQRPYPPYVDLACSAHLDAPIVTRPEVRPDGRRIAGLVDLIKC
jgi:hypothetical protein